MTAPPVGLYDPRNEHDSCGVGFVANLDARATHAMIESGIRVLENLVHRGAAGGDGKTGDGAGILVQIPDELLRSRCGREGMVLPERGRYGVGMLFLPGDDGAVDSAKNLVRGVVADEGLVFLGWRDVPVDPSALGETARSRQPRICQCFVDGGDLDRDDFERRLYLVRKQIEARARESGLPGDSLYVASLSCRTVVYKGMLMGEQLGRFYEDLGAADFVSALAVIHQRYSTNTFPSWKLAQPFRLLAHNGEINTLRGNRNQMRSREAALASALFGREIGKALPILDETGSDSACLDNALELLARSGRDLALSMMMLIPQAWGAKYPMGPELRGFFEYYAGLMEPWDGPAAVAFTDGTRVGALLDRNGLRPTRYTVLKNGFVVLASETGVLDLPQEDVCEKGSLRPGQMILADLEKNRLLKDGEIKSTYARRLPYRRWVEENKIVLHGLFNDVAPVTPDRARLLHRQRIFGYTREDVQMIIGPMAAGAHEPVGSMGNDAPLAVLSERPQLLFSYFRQLFAQVTNPPIDPIREELVMSLMTFMGNSPNILVDGPRNARLIKLPHPILSNEDLERIQSLNLRHSTVTTIPIGFAAKGGEYALEESLERVCRRAEEVAISRRALIVLSDRDLPDHEAPIPSLLAVSAVNQRLLGRGARTSSSIVIQTGEAREVHHVALLLGYGATALNPYLAFETVADLVERNALDVEVGVTAALENYISALCKGLRKTMSKMGISTLRSYRSAQVFEAFGLHKDVVERFFTGTSSRVGGLTLGQICREARARHEAALSVAPESRAILPGGGHYRYRSDGERHLWSPDAIHLLQRATRGNDPLLYERYAALINDQAERQSTLRGLFRFRAAETVPLEEVEPAEDIMKRFVTSAMSFGSISREAHETLAIAMNRIGAMSNSGEGGEDPDRYRPLPNGDSRSSAVKQVASARFGVTAEYLVNARELQIKMAQGAKPGEGGQLPGYKVNEEIARVRHSTPGVTLISPPPHHDIYSIEDIKQLIFDLKNVNPDARVSVKLVAELGVGTIAAGVAKAHADMVLISGHDGGTGASPLSSIKHVGIPWELGLAETQQTLRLNGLRDRIRVQADGQLKTGRDVVIAALLGAEEFGFATAPLVVCGCVMMRKCHENTCPVGVATQDPELRKRYTGKPGHVVNFFRMLAEEVRRHMASLGFRTMEEMIGRCDRLEMNEAVSFWKARGLDVSGILVSPGGSDAPTRCLAPRAHAIDDVLDRGLIREAAPALERGERVEIRRPIRNVDRATGAMLSGLIAKQYGHEGLPEGAIHCYFEGAAGQSFGAFAVRGLTMTLEGEANDYLGKGLSGGRIVVKPPAAVTYDPARNTICGNVLLYGATGGEVYIRGRVGERFAIRNSGARAVVEGVGDHACEYMTAGRVVILGETGINFAAGMSGGIAYVYDPSSVFDGRCNLDMVDLEIVEDRDDVEELSGLIRNHREQTGSHVAAYLLENWDASLPFFVKVFPMEYRRVLGRMSEEDEAIERQEAISA